MTDRTTIYGKLGGTITPPPSKSLTHRHLICAALADKPTIIRNFSDSIDTQATIDCLRALGADIQADGRQLTVTPLTQARTGRTLECMESASTLRFMLPLVSVLGCGATFTAKGRLPERPLSPLYEQLVSHGITLGENGKMPLECSGTLLPGEFTIESDVSSQFISGLLMAFPLAAGNCRILTTGKMESTPYIDMTVGVLKQYGINVIESRNTFTVPGGQKFRSPSLVTIESDWSAAAFWLLAGCIGRGIVCSGLEWAGSLQGDRHIVELLRNMGAKIDIGHDISALPSRLHGIDADCSDFPDLVPALAVAAAVAQGESTFTGIHRLRLKESDRVASVSSLLRTFGIQCSATQDSLHICGGYPLGALADPHGDHRIAMAAAILATAADGDSILKDSSCTAKSYPGFLDDFKRLGGKAISRN